MPRKPKYTIAELKLALEYLLESPHAIAREVAAWCVEWHIKQRTASKGNPGRPARPKQPKVEA